MNAAPTTAETLHELARLAYDDYRAARQRGENVPPAEFAGRYPEACRFELERLISVHLALVDEHPSWLAEIQEQFAGGSVPWPEVGSQWLGFELLSELGRGGLARVYLAAELAVGRRQVVLKVTPRETAEAHLLGKLTHAHIVPVWTVRRDDETGLWAVVMPYLGKATLHDVRVAATDHAAAERAAAERAGIPAARKTCRENSTPISSVECPERNVVSTYRRQRATNYRIRRWKALRSRTTSVRLSSSVANWPRRSTIRTAEGFCTEI